ncbi:MAG TPA: 16S rRNA (adenine(1518)-N(6)/adenine(1519)-N(6))-dimethyltransferase RsmA [Kofleriaceae bacterium]|nr:16S rRNA (adenine(1518)-N(6)/adenine(1519)-N(6))-dimethyltransferase RsmA [Kofleriaceae bacterium]
MSSSLGGEPFVDARVLLAKYGLAAKKSFGQNFLVNERAFRAIVDAAVTADDDWVVEIGAGLGTLTARLAERVVEGKVIALERDPDMIRVLRSELGNVENVQIEDVDALKYDLKMAARWRGDQINVAGNLPYHIAAPLLFRIVEARAYIKRAVVMIQKEMADRIVAQPGGKTYGALGVMIRTYMDTATVAKVGPGSFVPPPKIDSTVLRLTPLPNAGTRAPIDDEQHYSVVVHAGFGQRRKTLRNSMRAMFDDAAVDRALAATKIDGIRRAETLSIAEFAAFANALPPQSRRVGAEASTSEPDTGDTASDEDTDDNADTETGNDA